MPNSHKIASRHHSAMTRKKGFTLVEIAIVLVVIGLLLGGILQGQSLIRSMRVKDVVATAKDLTIASQQFKDRYRYLPGDWPFVANEIPGININDNGNGNGIIESAPIPVPAPGPGTTTESNNVPIHLFNAGFIRSPDLKSYYGATRVRNNPGNTYPSPIPATIQHVIEFDNLPCDVAVEVDLKLDDGNIAGGRSRASITPAACAIANTVVPRFATPL